MPDIDSLLTDREQFNAFVYTPWEEALIEINKRQGDSSLETRLDSLLPVGVPDIMKGKKSMVLFRHIATSNHEISRFLACADSLSELQPIIFEYTEDQFNNRNEWKYFLGKLRFYKGLNKQKEHVVEHKIIIDFNTSNNQSISSIKTKWGQSLVDFHHQLFNEAFPQFANVPFDLSSWLHANGSTAKDYYKAFLSLFLRDGILFENFMVDGNEHSFTKEIILPALLEIQVETGYKPLIVALEPTHIEGDAFWLSHPGKLIDFVNSQQVPGN